MIAALYVQTGGCYFGLDGVDPWDEARDARKYAGPWPVVAHPPCHLLGDDGGCFEAALSAVEMFGGVLEHPAESKAWDRYGLPRPPSQGGWIGIENGNGYTCCVEQGHYGHFARKRTWLYAVSKRRFGSPPELIWGASEQRLPAYAVERYGYAKARRIGVMAAIGGKRKTEIRNATPLPFRDLLIWIASTANLANGGLYLGWKDSQPVPVEVQ